MPPDQSYGSIVPGYGISGLGNSQPYASNASSGSGSTPSSSQSTYASTYDPTFNLNNPTYGIGTASPGTNTAIAGLLANLQPIAPTVDPRYSALQSTDIDLANNYAADSPGLVQGAYASAADAAANQLNQTNNASLDAYNNNGLAYSGLVPGAYASNQTATANNLANEMESLNSSAYNNQQTMNTNAMQPGFGIAGLGNNAYTSTTANEAQQAAQSEQQAQLAANAYGAIGQGLGSVAAMGIKGYANGNQTGNGLLSSSTNYSNGIVGDNTGGYGEMTYQGYMPGILPSYSGSDSYYGGLA